MCSMTMHGSEQGKMTDKVCSGQIFRRGHGIIMSEEAKAGGSIGHLVHYFTLLRPN